MSFMSLIPIIPLHQAGRMVVEDLELTVETLRCREDREASGLVKKVRQFFTHQSDLVNLSNKTNIDFFRVQQIFKSDTLPHISLYSSYCLHDIEIPEILPIDEKSCSASSRLLQPTTFNETEFKFR